MADRSDTISRRLKLRQLNVLVAVARWGSMAKAAEHLAISQPVVSKAVAELEQVVGVRLFDRVPGGVEPTPHGRALLKRSVAIFDDLRTSVSELETLSDPTAGELRIGCEENLSTGLLPTLIDRLTQKYPRLQFDVTLGDPATLQQRDLLNRRVELAIMRIAHQSLDHALQASVLCQDRMWVVAGMNNPGRADEKSLWRIWSRKDGACRPLNTRWAHWSSKRSTASALILPEGLYRSDRRYARATLSRRAISRRARHHVSAFQSSECAVEGIANRLSRDCAANQHRHLKGQNT
jgi:DNA-binding transcriptional LysR family regulator